MRDCGESADEVVRRSLARPRPLCRRAMTPLSGMVLLCEDLLRDFRSEADGVVDVLGNKWSCPASGASFLLRDHPDTRQTLISESPFLRKYSLAPLGKLLPTAGLQSVSDHVQRLVEHAKRQGGRTSLPLPVAVVEVVKESWTYYWALFQMTTPPDASGGRHQVQLRPDQWAKYAVVPDEQFDPQADQGRDRGLTRSLVYKALFAARRETVVLKERRGKRRTEAEQSPDEGALEDAPTAGEPPRSSPRYRIEVDSDPRLERGRVAAGKWLARSNIEPRVSPRVDYQDYQGVDYQDSPQVNYQQPSPQMDYLTVPAPVNDNGVPWRRNYAAEKVPQDVRLDPHWLDQHYDQHGGFHPDDPASSPRGQGLAPQEGAHGHGRDYGERPQSRRGARSHRRPLGRANSMPTVAEDRHSPPGSELRGTRSAPPQERLQDRLRGAELRLESFREAPDRAVGVLDEPSPLEQLAALKRQRRAQDREAELHRRADLERLGSGAPGHSPPPVAFAEVATPPGEPDEGPGDQDQDAPDLAVVGARVQDRRVTSAAPEDVTRVVPLDFYIESERQTLKLTDHDATLLGEVLTQDALLRHQLAAEGGAMRWPTYVAGVAVSEVELSVATLQPCDSQCTVARDRLCVDARLDARDGERETRQACIDLSAVVIQAEAQYGSLDQDPRLCAPAGTAVCARSLQVTKVKEQRPEALQAGVQVYYTGKEMLRSGQLLAPGTLGEVRGFKRQGPTGFDPRLRVGVDYVEVRFPEIGTVALEPKYLSSSEPSDERYTVTLHSYCFAGLVPLAEHDAKEFYALGLPQAIDSAAATAFDTEPLCANARAERPRAEAREVSTQVRAGPRFEAALAPIWVFTIGLASTLVLVVVGAHLARRSQAAPQDA